MESQGTWCGKTSPERSPATRERTSDASSKKSPGSQSREFLFLDLRKESGETKGQSWEMGIPLLGGCWMRSFGESPSAEDESFLSQILVRNAPERYSLSEKACLGILRRAEKKHKELPPLLKWVLEKQAGGGGVIFPVENHPQDSRVSISKDGKCQTLTGQMGTGGNNVPMVLEAETVGFHITQDPTAFVEKTPCLSTGNPKTGQACVGVVALDMYNQSISEVSPTLRSGSGGDTVPCAILPKCYGIGSQASNAMNSPNPHSGIYEADTSRTLDCHGGNPTCNQGGIVVIDGVYCLQGNMIGREDKNDPQGSGVNKEVSFTLNTIDHHAVAFAMQSYSEYKESDTSGCLRSRDFNGPQDIILDAVARRLMPLECSRLQGFPDNWVDGLSDADPSASDMAFWTKVFADWWALVGRAKGTKLPKDEKAIRRWLKSEPSDSEMYKMWGNGISLPCVLYVFEGIALQINSEDSSGVIVNHST